MHLFRRKATLTMTMMLWRERAEARGFSPKTVRNTETFFRMLTRFVPETVRLSEISAGRYEKIMLGMRKSGYATETIYDLNATLRKLLNLAQRSGLVRRNLLHQTENPKFIKQNQARTVSDEDFRRIMRWLETHEYWRGGVELYRKYRFLLSLLYHAGMRIGEALALTAADFVEVRDAVWRAKINKSYLYDFKLTKTTKNGKVREVPISVADFREFLSDIMAIRAREQSPQSNRGGVSMRIFDVSPQAVRQVLRRICRELELPNYRLHEFRHTFISRLVTNGVPLAVVAEVSGDTQTTVLRRYSHVLNNCDSMILAACASSNAAQPTRYSAQERLLGA